MEEQVAQGEAHVTQLTPLLEYPDGHVRQVSGSVGEHVAHLALQLTHEPALKDLEVGQDKQSVLKLPLQVLQLAWQATQDLLL